MTAQVRYKTRWRGIEVVIVAGSICELPETVDAVMVSGNCEGRMGGGVSQAVLRACSPALEVEAQRQRPPLGHTVILQASGRLLERGTSYVAYAAVLRQPIANGQPEDIRSCLTHFFAAADARGIKSVAIPLMGSKIGGLDSNVVADVIVESIQNYLLHPGEGQLRRVVLTGFNDSEATCFLGAMDRAFVSSIVGGHLLVVDVIQEFVGPNQLISAATAEALCRRINAVAQWVRAHAGQAIFVRDVHRPSDPELQYARPHAEDGSATLLPQLDIRPTDWTLDKHAYSAFFETLLEDRITAAESKTIYIVGIQTHVCVKYSTVDAMYRGFRPIVLSDLCAATTEERHSAGLEEVTRYCGEVCDSSLLLGLG